MSVYERLDRVHGLTSQNPGARYRVIYNKSGTFVAAAIVENESRDLDVGGQTVTVTGYVSDYNLYYFETEDLDHASYLTAVLNAPIVDQRLKPMQSRDQFGPRDITKKVLELPIPRFDPNEPRHRKLAKLGEGCTAKVEGWLARGGAGSTRSIGKLRSMVRAMLKNELHAIDELVRELLA